MRDAAPEPEAVQRILIRCARRARMIALKAKRDQAVARGDLTGAGLAHRRLVEHEIAEWVEP